MSEPVEAFGYAPFKVFRVDEPFAVTVGNTVDPDTLTGGVSLIIKIGDGKLFEYPLSPSEAETIAIGLATSARKARDGDLPAT